MKKIIFFIVALFPLLTFAAQEEDAETQKHLEDILNATEWFTDSSVQVKEGIVFLYGKTKTDENKRWAANLAKTSQGVIAVVNKIEVSEPSLLDLSIATKTLKNHWRGLIKTIPSIFIGIFILLFAWGLANLGTKTARSILRRKFPKSLLQDVIARAIGIAIFLLGVYLIFEMADLTGAALTVISGTGLLGIILGIAFRDITENFLASILLSVHSPFKTSDLIEIEGFIGYVQGITMRVTLLRSIEGNSIQIPNSIVYKSNIRNYTSNPCRRCDFTVGIGYEDSIAFAQEVGLKALKNHPSILKDPEPLVLAEALDTYTINLRVYFWIDSRNHNWEEVKSELIHLIKHRFQEAGISMPDGSHKMIMIGDNESSSKKTAHAGNRT